MWFNAAVLSRVDAPLEIVELSLRELRPDEVLVRVAAAGVCHTDYEAMKGTFPTPAPTVLGHEGAGVIEAVGADVRDKAVGDHVVCTIYPNCGTCFYCRRTLPMLCEATSGAESPLRTREGGSVNNFLNVSSFAEYCVVPSRGAIRIPSAMPLDRACLLGCAVITGVGAVLRIANVRQGESVAVVGCGAVGLNTVQGARMAGAATIIAIDTNPAKLAKARLFGATHTLLVAGDHDKVVSEIQALTQGRGADHSFEAAGVVRSLELTLRAARPGATVTILGKAEGGQPISVRFSALAGERRILRSSLGGARAADDFPLFANAYLEGRLMLDEQIDLRVPLSSINQAMEEVARGEVIRSVVILDSELLAGVAP